MAFSDDELIARVLESGEPEGFAELVRRYQSPVRGFLRRMTRGDEALADDLAQETFLRAWRKLENYRRESKFSTWLFGIAMNEFRGQARRMGRRAEEQFDDAAPGHELSVEAVSPGVWLDVDAALLKLTPGERAAIVLCCQNGLTHEEAALALRLPLGTVKTNVLRGKEKLRRLLEL